MLIPSNKTINIQKDPKKDENVVAIQKFIDNIKSSSILMPDKQAKICIITDHQNYDVQSRINYI